MLRVDQLGLGVGVSQGTGGCLVFIHNVGFGYMVYGLHSIVSKSK